MKIYLLEKKIQKVTKECSHTINKRSVMARYLAHLIGLLSLTALAVSVAPLHYRGLQRLRQRALQRSRGNYDNNILCRWRGRSRSSVVDRTPARIQRSPSCPTLSRHGIDNRCLKIWLGSNRSGMQYRGYVDSGQENSLHKLPGDESSSISFAEQQGRIFTSCYCSTTHQPLHT